MKKYLKIGASFIISLSLFLGLVASAEVSKVDGAKEKEIKKVEVKTVDKEKIKNTKLEFKSKLDSMVVEIKAKRDEFKKELNTTKELTKQKLEAKKIEFKAELEKIKDAKKKTATEKIIIGLNELNVKLTDQFSNKIDQIEAVLVSVQSRIDKAGSRDLNVALPSAQVLKAKEAIAQARQAITTQSKKTYEVSINETTLKTDMKKLRDTFRTDIKAVSDKVKSAHVAVRNTATNLAQIPKIDQDEDNDDVKKEKGIGEKNATGEVENNSATAENN